MIAALLAVYVFWGSTAPALKVAVTYLPPFELAALRFAIAGALVFAWCRVRRVAFPTAAEWRAGAFTGTLLLVAGNGVFVWVLQYLPSGIGALFFALSPLFMAIFAYFMFGERLSRLAACGLVLGLAGMLYLYSPTAAQSLPLGPTIVGVFTSVVWAYGSLVQRYSKGSDVVQMSAIQMLVAATLLALAGVASGEHMTLAQFTPPAIAAMLYLIIFGSIVAFSAYLWLFNSVPTALASTYAYVNPVVSLVVAIGLLHERFSWQLVAGAATIIGGVAFMALAGARAAAAAESLPRAGRRNGDVRGERAVDHGGQGCEVRSG